jgi:CBS domain-containing protein
MKFTVNIVMTCAVETISPGATLEDAAQKMRLHNVGFLPVVDDTKLKVIGVITDRDIVLRAVADRLRPEMTRVSDVMTSKPICCYQDQTLGEASWLMEKNFVHRLMVLNRNDELVGIVSLSDLAAKARKEKLSGHVLGKVSVA